MHLRIQFLFSTGLDFSGSPPYEQNAVVFENAIMGPFLFPVEHNLVVNSKNLIQTGRTATSCNQVTNGGIAIIFTGDQTLYGSYGGTEGKPAGIGTLLLSNIFTINACQQSPVIIHSESSTPEPVDGTLVGNLDLYNSVLGYGKAQGVISITPNPYKPDKFRARVRNTFTFPV